MKKIFFCILFIIIIYSVYCNTLNDIIDNTIRYNKWEDAKVELENYINNNPTDTYANSLYASVLNELKMYDEAIIAIRNAINFENTSNKKGYMYTDLGTYYYNKGLIDQAIQNYQTSLELNKNIDTSYYMMGLIYYEKKDYENAIYNWKKYIAITNNIPKKRKLQEALKLFESDLQTRKLKEEEEKRKKEEFLKKLKDELSQDEKDTTSLETDKDKTDKSDEVFLEIDE